MRSFYSLSLLLLFIANTIGGVCILHFHHIRIKENVKSIICNGHHQIPIVELVIPVDQSAEVIWLEDRREFSYREEMYDVVCIEVKKDTTIYHCIHDKIEKGLRQEIADNTHQPFPGQYQDRSVALQFFKIIAHIIITQSSFSDLVFNEKLRSIFTYQHIFQPVCLSQSGEPPDFA